ncbi:MAG: hypothetical protein ABWY78_19375, partial [Microvirga sp.]
PLEERRAAPWKWTAGWKCLGDAVDRHHAPLSGAFWVELGRRHAERSGAWADAKPIARIEGSPRGRHD